MRADFSCRSFHVVGALKQKAVFPSSVFTLGTFSVSQSFERVPCAPGFHSIKELIYNGKVPSIALKIDRYQCLFRLSAKDGQPTLSYRMQ